ncbi:MAG: mechanosensitive ion channel [Cytophagales bacterium]|nr:mechanosensitive ion channel [Cytophagales bacterium]
MKFILFSLFLSFGLILPIHGQEDSVSNDSVSAFGVDDASVAVSQDSTIMAASYINQSNSFTSPPPIQELISFPKIFWSLVLALIGYLFIRFSIKTLVLFAERNARYRITIRSFIPVVKIFGWITVVFLIVAGIFQPPAATLLAFSASIGVAVGFASQDILKNIFGGIVILLDRPFKSGDKIEVGGHYGEVVEIGLRSTRIITPDDNLVSVPNSEIMNHSVSNANAGESNCQVSAEVFLPLNADLQRAKEIGIEAAKVSTFIYLNKPVGVIFTQELLPAGKTMIKMKIKAYVSDIRDEFRFKSELVERATKTLLEEKLIKTD